MRIGIISSDIVANEIVTAMAQSRIFFDHLILSICNGDVAAQLASLEARIRFVEHNQQVVDDADVLCVAISLETVREMQARLTFRAHQRVISFLPSNYSVSRLIDQLERVV
jgi:pyrroline-5-carboxylate reductase